MKRVLVADDHPIVLQGIMMLLAPLRLAVVARCSNGAEALEAALRLKPDMAILDQSMPPLSGIDVALRLRQEGLPTKVLLLTDGLSSADLQRALALEIPGIVLKDMAPDVLEEAIQTVLSGGVYVDTGVFTKISGANAEAPEKRGLELLSPREREIAELVRSGLRNAEIAARLNLTEGTVKVFLNKIYTRLNVTRRHQLIDY